VLGTNLMLHAILCYRNKLPFLTGVVARDGG